ILDGNVARVLCRLDKIRSDPRAPKTVGYLWKRAGEILPDKNVGEFNSALMELGATVCMPRSPCCLMCPVQKFCESFAAGLQDKIPAPRKTRPTPIHRRWTICVNHEDRYLIEQRPAKGRWAGMWQFVTIPSAADVPTPSEIGRHLGLSIK